MWWFLWKRCQWCLAPGWWPRDMRNFRFTRVARGHDTAVCLWGSYNVGKSPSGTEDIRGRLDTGTGMARGHKHTPLSTKLDNVLDYDMKSGMLKCYKNRLFTYFVLYHCKKEKKFNELINIGWVRARRAIPYGRFLFMSLIRFIFFAEMNWYETFI